MAGAVRVVDRGADGLLRRLREASSPMRVRVGVIGDEAEAQHQGGTLTTAAVASFHEFGLGVPERSFIRAWADENDGELRRRLRAISTAVVKRRLPVEPGLEQFGLKAVADIVARIRAGIEPGLDDATKDRKGSSTPLIDTGQLVSSITHVVERGEP